MYICMISVAECKNMFTLKEKFQEAKNLVCQIILFLLHVIFCNSWVEGEGCEQFEVHLIQMEKILPLNSYKNTQTSQREVYMKAENSYIESSYKLRSLPARVWLQLH